MIIPGFSRYDITTDGVVTMTAIGKVVKPRVVKVRNSWYKQVTLVSDTGRCCAYNVLALLALVYMDKPLHVGIVRAKDGNNLNTVLDNVYCTTQAEITRETWESGGLKERRRRGRCFDEDSIEMVYYTMLAYGRPTTMSELSNDLDVPYTTIRYSVEALRKQGKVHKTKDGFEVIT